MRFLACASALLISLAAPVGAATFLVNPDGSGDLPTLQAAVDASAAGDTILLGDGTFAGPGNRELTIERPRLLAAAGEPGAAILDAEDLAVADLGVDPDASEVFRFEGIVFRHGGGIEASHNKQVEFADCRFEHCGELVTVWPYVIPLGIIRAERCRFIGCEGRLLARRVELTDSGFLFSLGQIVIAHELSALRCSFHDCYDLDGGWGGLFRLGAEAGYDSDYDFADCVFFRAAADAVIRVPAGDNFLRLTGCTFVDDQGAGSCDVSVEAGSPAVQVERCIFAFRSEGEVFGIEAGASTPQLTDCDIFGNAAGDWVDPIADQFGLGCNMSDWPRFCDWLGGNLTLNYDSPCLPANNACGVLIGAEEQGCMEGTTVEAVPGGGASLAAHPNPFNPSVRLSFTLAAAGPVSLSVYDASGRRVATPIAGQWRSAGEHAIDWRADGLTSGVYLARLEARGLNLETKLTLLR